MIGISILWFSMILFIAAFLCFIVGAWLGEQIAEREEKFLRDQIQLFKSRYEQSEIMIRDMLNKQTDLKEYIHEGLDETEYILNTNIRYPIEIQDQTRSRRTALQGMLLKLQGWI